MVRVYHGDGRPHPGSSRVDSNGRLIVQTLIGTTIGGRYRVVTRLGTGGMGQVFLVDNLENGRKEALKLLHVMSATRRNFAARFRREARVLGRLVHPGIVAYYDSGQIEDGRLYLAMEYAKGRDLGSFVKARTRIRLARALPILSEIAKALDYAHKSGVIHRDLKPSNVVLTEQVGAMSPKLLDFGLAKIIQPGYDDSVAATSGLALGTPRYMAPELLRRQNYDWRIDIYSFGCLAYELLVGCPPFTGNVVQVCEAHVRAPIPRIRDQPECQKVPREIDQLVAECLEKDPDCRVQPVSTIANVIDAAFRQLPPRHDPEAALDTKVTLRTPRLRRKQEHVPASPPRSLCALLIDLVRRILDLGDRHPALLRVLVAYTSLMEQEAAVRLNQAERDGLNLRRDTLVQCFHQQEAALRFMLGELSHSTDNLQSDLSRSFETRLARYRMEAEQRRAELDRDLAAIESIAARAQRDFNRQQIITRDALSSVIDEYRKVPGIDALWSEINRQAAQIPSA